MTKDIHTKLDKIFTWNHIDWQLVHINSHSAFIRSLDDNSPQDIEMKIEDFMFHWNEGEFNFQDDKNPAPIKNLTKENLKKCRYIRFIAAFLNPLSYPTAKRNLAGALDELHREHPESATHIRSISTVYRLFSETLRGRSATDIVIGNQPCTRKSKFSEDQLDLLNQVIDDKFLVKGGLKGIHLYEYFTRMFNRSLIEEKIMSQSTFYDRLSKISTLDIIVHRKGRKAGFEYSKANKATIDTMYTLMPLQYVEMDALYINIPMVTEYGEYDGTLIVYGLIDRTTRNLVGYHMETTGPNDSKESASGYQAAITHALLPKEPSSYGVWPKSGEIQTLIMDPSAAATSNYLSEFISAIDITAHITETSAPEKKPFVERAFGTFRTQFFAYFRGYHSSDNREGYDKNRHRYGGYTIEEVKHKFEEYILKNYHESAHKGLDDVSPSQAWEQDTRIYPIIPFTNERRLRAFLGVIEQRKIQHNKGLEINKVFYNNRELQNWRIEGITEKIQFRYNVNDISKIVAIHPLTNETLMVSNTKGIVPGTSLKEYRGSPPRYKRSPDDQPSSPASNVHDNLREINEKHAKAEREYLRNKKKPKSSPSTELENVSDEEVESYLDDARGHVTEQYLEPPETPSADPIDMHFEDFVSGKARSRGGYGE